MGSDIFEGLSGRNTTPYAKVMSAIVSLIILFLIFFDYFPDYRKYLFLFLTFHLINHLVSGLIESKKYCCHICGKPLKIKSYNFEEHECKNATIKP